MSTTPRRLGQYELLQTLGRGHMGEVWKARDLNRNCNVAIKVFFTDLQSDPYFFQRFTTYTRTLTTLKHQHILNVHEARLFEPATTSGIVAAMAMDYVEVYTLDDYLQTTSRRNHFPSIDNVIYLFKSLGSAIDYAHKQGIVHGNLTPGNILLQKQQQQHFFSGEPIITDLGIAQIAGNRNAYSSPLYIAPEQAGGLPAEPVSDIYTLGVLLYEICTGVPPFRGDQNNSVLKQHIETLPIPPMLINTNIPPELSAIILTALAKKVTARFSNATQLAASIAEACSRQSVFHIPVPHIERPKSTTKIVATPKASSLLGVSQPEPKPALPRPQTIKLPVPDTAKPQYPAASATPHVPATPSSPLQATGPISRISAKIQLVSLPGETTISASNSKKELIPPKITMPSTYSQPRLRAVQPPMVTPPALAQPQAPATLPFLPHYHVPKSLQTMFNFNKYPPYIIAAIIIVVLVILGSLISLSLALNHSATTTASNQPVIFGHIFFQDDAIGTDDQLHVELNSIPAPATGQGYFAWIIDEHQQAHLLGALPVRNGQVSYTYPGDSKHTNLISYVQSIIITKNASGTPPVKPGTNVVYSATFASMILPLIQNILYKTPGLATKGTAINNMYTQVQGLNDKAVSIVDSIQSGSNQNNELAIRQAVRIIQMIDGSKYAASSGDLPAGIPGELNIPIGLISSPTQQGYLDILNNQLLQLKGAEGNDQQLLQHIRNAQNAITDLKTWLQNIRIYTVQILKAKNLSDPTIVNTALQLSQTAADAYTGRTIPPNNSPQPVIGSAGALQCYTEVQYLAELNVQP
ncbi:MAG TPA: protein kinase [Dictyobacter sp.]|nr:protein kinase [Dictyobacter sp.]